MLSLFEWYRRENNAPRVLFTMFNLRPENRRSRRNDYRHLQKQYDTNLGLSFRKDLHYEFQTKKSNRHVVPTTSPLLISIGLCCCIKIFKGTIVSCDMRDFFILAKSALLVVVGILMDCFFMWNQYSVNYWDSTPSEEKNSSMLTTEFLAASPVSFMFPSSSPIRPEFLWDSKSLSSA